MTESQAQKLLSMYADGLLEEDECREIEAVLADSPKLQAELNHMLALRKSGQFRPVSGQHPTHTQTPAGISDEMLAEALAPLRPSVSSRMRVADAMRAVHAQAQYVANTMPEGKWRMARLLICLASFCVAVWFAWTNKSLEPLETMTVIFSYTSAVLFVIGNILLLAGRPLAGIEARMLGLISKRDPQPSRLEVLVLEIFGVCCLLVAGIVYWAML